MCTSESTAAVPFEKHVPLLRLRTHVEAIVRVNSTDTDDVRVVVLMPSYEWGGEGCLGADIGYGYLHRLPAKCCATLGRSGGKTVGSRAGL